MTIKCPGCVTTQQYGDLSVITGEERIIDWECKCCGNKYIITLRVEQFFTKKGPVNVSQR